MLGPCAWMLLLGSALGMACTSTPEPDPLRYRLAGSGSDWKVSGRDRVLEDLHPRYPEFFEVVLDPTRDDEPDIRELRSDLERQPIDRRNYDALNAVALAYFEINLRGEAARETQDVAFLSAGFRTAKLVALPWSAYGEVDDGPFRDAILDFFEDAGLGHKRGASATSGRLARIVESLARKETDPARRARIEWLAGELREPTGDAETR